MPPPPSAVMAEAPGLAMTRLEPVEFVTAASGAGGAGGGEKRTDVAITGAVKDVTVRPRPVAMPWKPVVTAAWTAVAWIVAVGGTTIVVLTVYVKPA